MNLLEEIRKFRELVLRKQDRLTPGAHITIDEDNVISADIGGAEELEGRVEALEEETENLDIRMDGAEYVVTVLSDDLDELQQKVDNIHGFNIVALKDGEFDPQTLIPSIEDPLENTLYLVPNIGDSDKNLWVEWLWIKGAWEQFGIATIDLNKYVKKTDYANSKTAGVVKTSAINGVETNSSGQLIIKSANQADVASGTSLTLPLTPGMQHYAAFYGLARAAKAPTLSYTSQDKVAIRLMIDAGSHAQVEELAASVIYIEDKTKDIINKSKTTEPGKIWMSNNEGAGWSDVPAIPSKTSELTNDSGFITSAVVPSKTSDLINDSNFITDADVPTKVSDLENDTGFITEEDVPEIPSKTSDLTNDSGFVTEEDVPTKTSDLVNDSGFITRSDIPESVVLDVKVDGVSVVDETTGSANIDTSEFGKVQDVTVDGTSVLDEETGIAEIPKIPENTSDLQNDSGYITMDDLEPGVNVTQDNNGDIKITGLGGGISGDIELELERLRNQMNAYYNELKALIQSYHPNPPEPTANSTPI